MSTDLREALACDLALITLDPHLIERAADLGRCGFEAVSRSQMAAVGELVRSAASHANAVTSVKTYLGNQLDRLRAKESRGGAPGSGLAKTRHSQCGADCLGDELGAWIERGLYLPEQVPAGLDRLAALRRFWDRFHGMVRYREQLGHPMRLSVRELSPGEGEVP